MWNTTNQREALFFGTNLISFSAWWEWEIDDFYWEGTRREKGANGK